MASTQDHLLSYRVSMKWHMVVRDTPMILARDALELQAIQGRGDVGGDDTALVDTQLATGQVQQGQQVVQVQR